MGSRRPLLLRSYYPSDTAFDLTWQTLTHLVAGDLPTARSRLSLNGWGGSLIAFGGLGRLRSPGKVIRALVCALARHVRACAVSWAPLSTQHTSSRWGHRLGARCACHCRRRNSIVWGWGPGQPRRSALLSRVRSVCPAGPSLSVQSMALSCARWRPAARRATADQGSLCSAAGASRIAGRSGHATDTATTCGPST